MPTEDSTGTRLRAWERATEWPLTGAAVVFLGAYAWEVLTNAQGAAKETVRASSLRSAHALDLVDFAVANPSFTVRKVEAALGISYGRANGLVAQLTDIGVLDVVETGSQPRRFAAPAVLKVLLT